MFWRHLPEAQNACSVNSRNGCAKAVAAGGELAERAKNQTDNGVGADFSTSTQIKILTRTKKTREAANEEHTAAPRGGRTARGLERPRAEIIQRE